MNKPTFTKGPWTSGWVGEKPHGTAVVWIPDSSNERIEVHTSNARANARLIAAAPELYEQCKFLEEMLTGIDHPSSPKLAELRELLAKVEGEK